MRRAAAVVKVLEVWASGDLAPETRRAATLNDEPALVERLISFFNNGCCVDRRMVYGRRRLSMNSALQKHVTDGETPRDSVLPTLNKLVNLRLTYYT